MSRIDEINIGGKADKHFRYKMPSLVAKVEGSGNGIKTVIVNMVDIAAALKVDPDYPTRYFGYELGAQSHFDIKTGRAVVNGDRTAGDLSKLLDGFIKKFVLCPNCKYPELLMSVSKSAVNIKCKSCPFSGTFDPREKLTNYIQKNPPKKGGADHKKDTMVQHAGEDEWGKKKDKKKKDKKKKKSKEEEEADGGSASSSEAGEVDAKQADEEKDKSAKKKKKDKKKKKKEKSESDDSESDAGSGDEGAKKKKKKKDKKKDKKKKKSKEVDEEEGSASESSGEEKEGTADAATEAAPLSPTPAAAAAAAAAEEEEGSQSDEQQQPAAAAVASTARQPTSVSGQFADLKIAPKPEVEAILAQAQKDGKADSPVTMLRVYIAERERSVEEVHSEVRRLGIARGYDELKRLKILSEALIDLEAKKMAASFNKYKAVFKMFCKAPGAQGVLLMALEEVLGTADPKITARTAWVLQTLYESEVLEEASILSWAETPEASVNKAAATKVRQAGKAFFDWLKNAEEEEEEDD